MRLIDADALIEDSKKYLNTLNPDNDGKECVKIYWLINVLNEASNVEQDPDTISRQQAIDAFLTELTKRERKNLLHTWSTVEVKYFVVDMLEKLSSAQPEIIRCNECKHWLDIDDGRQKHRMCADVYGDWFCADVERKTDGD